jgi:hypothetical protein
MFNGGINLGFVGGLRSLADGRPLRGPVGPHVAAVSGGHPIEFWLTVVPAAGILSFGWFCVALKAINRLCRDAANPATQAAWLTNAARGQRVETRQRIAWWLWSAIEAGTWSDDFLNLGRWMTMGTLAGATVGSVLYLFIG